MLPEERRVKILNLLKENGKVEVDNLSQKLGVSPMTVRRDLCYLENKGLVMRTHGGAVYPDILNYEVPYNSKEIESKSEKERIGRAAAELIKEGQSIVLDAGTTGLEVAKNIKHIKGITVITNDIRIAMELYTSPDIKLYCVGGLVQHNVGAVIGNYAESFVDLINVDYAFLGVASIDEDYMVSTPTPEKAFLKKKIMEHSNVNVLMADHTKFNKKSLNRICSVADADILISDSSLSPKITAYLEKAIGKLILT